jgi:hypothetical protein
MAHTLVECGCDAKVYADRSGVYIEYCNLHRAAPKLLEACEFFVDILDILQNFGILGQLDAFGGDSDGVIYVREQSPCHYCQGKDRSAWTINELKESSSELMLPILGHGLFSKGEITLLDPS